MNFHHATQLIDDLARQKEAAIVDVIRLRARQPFGVRIEKPRWMPEWVFRRLLRSIIVTEGPLTIDEINR